MNEEEGKHKNKEKTWNKEKTTRPEGGGERKKINGYRQENITKGV